MAEFLFEFQRICFIWLFFLDFTYEIESLKNYQELMLINVFFNLSFEHLFEALFIISLELLAHQNIAFGICFDLISLFLVWIHLYYIVFFALFLSSFKVDVGNMVNHGFAKFAFSFHFIYQRNGLSVQSRSMSSAYGHLAVLKVAYIIKHRDRI